MAPKVLEESSEFTREHWESVMRGVEERTEKIQTENKTQLAESIKSMSDDLKVIERGLEPMKSLSRDSYELIVDLHLSSYRHGSAQASYMYIRRGWEYPNSDQREGYSMNLIVTRRGVDKSENFLMSLLSRSQLIVRFCNVDDKCK